MRIVAILAWLIAFSAAVLAEPAVGPEAVVAEIYKAYEKSGPLPDHGDVFSAKLKGLIEADKTSTPQGEVGKLDWDVFIDGNDWEIKGLAIKLLSKTADRASVSARFENFGEPREILIELVPENGRWAVDEVASTLTGARWTMSKILLGAPDAFPDEPPAEGELDGSGGRGGVPAGEGME